VITAGTRVSVLKSAKGNNPPRMRHLITGISHESKGDLQTQSFTKRGGRVGEGGGSGYLGKEETAAGNILPTR